VVRRTLAALARFFDVRPGEGKSLVFTFLYIALAVSSFLLAKPIRNGLFLSEYGPQRLVYVYVAVPLALSIAVPLFGRMAVREGQRLILTGSLLFFCANVLLFWYLFRFHESAGLPAVFYVWVNCYGIIAPVQAWSFANSVFDTRQARRLFGLVGSGASVGAIVSGLIAYVLTPRIGTVNLLLVLAALIALAALVVNLGWKARRFEQRSTAAGRPSSPFRDALAAMQRSTYLRFIGAMVFIVAIVTQWTQFQFSLAATERFGGDRDLLTSFFGSFNLWLGLAAFAIQLFATGPALRTFGVGVTILVLPVLLGLGQLLTVVAPALPAVLLTNAFDQGFRFSLDKATFELLYLPLPSRVRVGVKSVIDVLINRIGDGLGGLLLGLATSGFLMVPGLGLGLRGLAAITLVLIAVWSAAALAVRRGYVEAITDSIHQHRLRVERATGSVLDRSAAAILTSQLDAADPDAIIYALDLFELDGGKPPLAALRSLLSHPSTRVRTRAIRSLSRAGDRGALSAVEPLLQDPDLDVRTEALLFVAYQGGVDPLARIRELGDFADFSIRAGMIAFLAQPGRMQNLEAARLLLYTMAHEEGEEGTRSRLEAAGLIARLPDEFGSELAHLLDDDHVDVVRRAMATAASLGRRDMALAIVARLSDPRLRDAARSALVALGAGVLPTLGEAFADSRRPLAVRRELPEVIAQIGTVAARRILTDNLLQPDVTLRMRVIAGLNRLRQLSPEVQLDRQAIEMVLLAEIVGHYRSYQILGSLGDGFGESEAVRSALDASMQQELERIFRLMGLRWPQFDIYSAYVGLRSQDSAVRANALEFLDNVLRPQVRALIVPLLDPLVSVEERVERANRLLGTAVDTREQAVATLVASDDPWLKSVGAYAIGELGMTALEPELDRLSDSDDPLLLETIRVARARLSGEAPSAAIPPAPTEPEPGGPWQPTEGPSMGVG
jgi:ATP:ADP antiporter, AAA family